jgi:CDGSH-type Zn-finger protein
MSQRPTIELRPNGPLLIKNLKTLENSKGERIPTETVIALCRCGGSANKPFCDGTHKKIGFADEKLADGSADRLDDYPGAKITIHDNRGICAHAGHCTDGLASVFKYGQEPWIDPEGADIAAIIATIQACPSGALSYSIENVEHGAPERAPAISVTKDGPYAVSGGVEMIGQSFGAGASAERYTLCRCGGSKNKPFCDGTHYSIGFEDQKN